MNRRGMLKQWLALGSLPFAHLGFAKEGGANAGDQVAIGSPGGDAVDPLTLVPAELRPALDKIRAIGPMPMFSAQSLPGLRSARWPGMPVPAATPTWERRLIPGPVGAPEVPVYLINAQPAGSNAPAVLHIHGGGFVTGRAESAVPQFQAVARELNCVVVSVDYRLAPETPFPGSREDNYAALRWMYAAAHDLGIDRGRIAVMGESAGGGHAAMLAIAARDRREYPLVAQILIYPMLDDRTGSTNQVPAHIGQYLWTRTSNRFGWSSLLGQPAGLGSVPAGAVPARVSDLSGLPPTFIGVGSIDLFVGEDMDYARRLVDAGVQTELVVVPGAFHGFDGLTSDAPLSKRFRENWMGALKRAFA